jgi:hypothetical protein
LRYPRNGPASQPGEKPQEKGIDVALAIEFVAMAVSDQYDIGIMMSTDTDLKPALEFVAALPGKRPEVCSWSSNVGHSRRLSIAGSQLWCHWIGDQTFRSFADPTDYNLWTS